MSTAKHTGWAITLGILLMLLGIITLSAQVLTTYVSLLFFGWMLIIGGIIEFFYGFFARSVGQSVVFFIGGIFSFLTGVLIVAFPELSASTITLFIGIFMLVVGLYNTFSSIISRYHSWGWFFVGGLLSFVLGFMILARWPVSGLWVIGLFISIQLFVSGFFFVLNARKSAEEKAAQFGDTKNLSGIKGGESDRSEKENTPYENNL